MSDGEAKPVQGTHHCVVEIEGLEQELLFQGMTPPGATIQTRKVKTWDAKGIPLESLQGGRQVQWSDLTLTRGVDANKALWKWFKDIMDKGVTGDTKKKVTVKVVGEDPGETINTYTLEGAVITSYQQAASNAEDQSLLTEQISIQAEKVMLE